MPHGGIPEGGQLFQTHGIKWGDGSDSTADSAYFDTKGNLIFNVGQGAGSIVLPGGAVLRSGAGVPANTLGDNGDFYLDKNGTAAACLYQKSGGAWAVLPTLGNSPSGAAGGSLTGNFPNPVIAAAAVSTNMLASGAVASGNIASAAVISGAIASGAVASYHIAAGAVGSLQIGHGQVGSAHYALSSITATFADSTIEKTANKNVANGYLGLTGSITPAPANLGLGTRSGSNFLRDDGLWAAPPGAASVPFSVLRPSGGDDTTQLTITSSGEYWLTGGTFSGSMQIKASNVVVRCSRGTSIKPANASNTVAVKIGDVNSGTTFTDIEIHGLEINGNGANQTMTTLGAGADAWSQKYGAQGLVAENIYRLTIRDINLHDTWNTGMTIHACGAVTVDGGEVFNTGVAASTLPCNGITVEALSSTDATYPSAGISFANIVNRKATSVIWDLHGTGSRQISCVNCYAREPVAAAELWSIEIESSDTADNRLVSIIGGSSDGTNISQAGTGFYLQVTSNNTETQKLVSIVGHPITNVDTAFSVQGQGITVSDCPMNNVAIGVTFNNNNQVLQSRDIVFTNCPITLASSGLATTFGAAVGLYLRLQASMNYDNIQFSNIPIRTTQSLGQSTYCGVYTAYAGTGAQMTNLTLDKIQVNGFHEGFSIGHLDTCQVTSAVAASCNDFGLLINTGAQPYVLGGNLTGNVSGPVSGANQSGVRISGVRGLNPVGLVTQPGTAGSLSAITNTTGYDCMVQLTGSVTSVKVGGTTMSGSTFGPYRVPAGQTIQPTGTQLNWQWFAD